MVRPQLNQTNMRMPLSAPRFPGRRGALRPRLCLAVFWARLIKTAQQIPQGRTGPRHVGFSWLWLLYDFISHISSHVVECLIDSKSLKTPHAVCSLEATLPLPPAEHFGAICHSLYFWPCCCRGAERKRNKSVHLIWEQVFKKMAKTIDWILNSLWHTDMLYLLTSPTPFLWWKDSSAHSPQMLH